LSATERESYSLGIKLTCAYELLANSTSSTAKVVVDIWTSEREKKVDDITIRGWSENLETPDGEEWMVLSAEDIKRITAEDKGEEEQIKDMIANLERFIEGESGFEGIDDEFDGYEEFDSDDDEVS